MASRSPFSERELTTRQYIPARISIWRKEILESGGALITEYPPKTPSLKQNFPARNRIMAGLALGTLVVEAADRFRFSHHGADCALEFKPRSFCRSRADFFAAIGRNKLSHQKRSETGRIGGGYPRRTEYLPAPSRRSPLKDISNRKPRRKNRLENAFQ